MVLKVRTSWTSGVMAQATTDFLCTCAPPSSDGAAMPTWKTPCTVRHRPQWESCAKTAMPTKTPLTAVGIQSPFDAPRRLCQRRHPPSSSPQWESRALSMRQHGYTNGDTSRHSHRSGNPEPFRCANTVTVTEIRQVGAQACPLGLLVRAIPS